MYGTYESHLNRKWKLRSWSVENFLCQRANISIGKIARSAEYQMDEKFSNVLIFGTIFRFSKLKRF